MTTRRSFMAGLLATAATGAAQACPAQPATVFCGLDPAAPAKAGTTIWRVTHYPGLRVVYWSDREDFTAWGAP